MLASITLGLLSAISWGAGDFCGGLAARRANVYAVVIASQAGGGLILALLALAFGEAVPPATDLAWGAAAGLAGAVGLLALYHGLATGRMGLVAPLSAVLGAALPVLASLWFEGWPLVTQWLGFALALAGIWQLSRPEKAAWDWQQLTLPLVAGVGFGLFFVLLHQGSAIAVFWPLVGARTVSFLCLTSAALALRQPLQPTGWSPALLGLIILTGVLDAGGNALYALAAQAGPLSVAAVLASLYPASTVFLASGLLKERLTRPQWWGVLAVLAAIVCITLPPLG